MPNNRKERHLDSRALAKHKKRFLKFFPKSFRDQRYIDWERTYKWEAHELWDELLNKAEFSRLLKQNEFGEIAARALRVESKTNFLFSFEKMAFRDALRTTLGARIFAEGLYQLLYDKEPLRERFISWIVSVNELPRIKSRVASWPVVTLLPFIAQPENFIIMKPTAMKVAAYELNFELDYSSKPSWTTYESLLQFAELTREGISDLKPKDFHDIQSFLWVIGSSEYERLEEEL